MTPSLSISRVTARLSLATIGKRVQQYLFFYESRPGYVRLTDSISESRKNCLSARFYAPGAFSGPAESRRSGTKKKALISCNGRMDVMYRRARKETEKRRERDGTTQRRLREQDTSERRLSRHYLERTIKRRQRPDGSRTIHGSTISTCRDETLFARPRSQRRTTANAIVPRS